MRGRPTVGDNERAVNFAEYTAPKKYKDAIEDLAYRTQKNKHYHFREALKEYTARHNVEYFIKMEREEIAAKEEVITEMQTKIRARDKNNMLLADAAFRRILSDQMYLGVKITHGYREHLANQIAQQYQLNHLDVEVLELCENIYIEFVERYKGNYRSIKEI